MGRMGQGGRKRRIALVRQRSVLEGDIGHDAEYRTRNAIMSIYRNKVCNLCQHAVISSPKRREEAWISSFPIDRKRGEGSYRPSSTRRCCRAIAPFLNTRLTAAKPCRSWPNCKAKRATC